jgi:hypothetical protein
MFQPKVEHELPANSPARIRRIADTPGPVTMHKFGAGERTVEDIYLGVADGYHLVFDEPRESGGSWESVTHAEITNPANGILDRLSTLDVFRLTYHDARIHGIKHVLKDDHAPTQDMKVGAIACMLIGAALPVAGSLGIIATRILS